MSASLTTHDGLRLHVTPRGRVDAPVTVLLAHCWTADEHDWHYQVHDLLTRYGHDVRVVTWDHRGHGRSERCAQQDCTIANLANDLGAVVDEFAPQGRLVLAGHSVGGMAMSAIPEERPDLLDRIAGLLFVSTSSGRLDQVSLGLPDVTGQVLRDRLPFLLAARARLLSRSKRMRQPVVERQITRRLLFGRPQTPRDVGLVVDQIINCPPETMAGFYRDCLRHERTDALKAFDDVPATILVGSRDVLTPPDHATRIARGIRGARLLVAPDAGHYLPLERQQLVSGELVSMVDQALTT